MKEFVFVKFGDEKSTIEKAPELGYSELILIYSSLDKDKISLKYKKELKSYSKINLLFGLDVKNQKETNMSVFDVFLQLGTMKDVVFKKINYVYNNELEEQKDFIHQRRSGLNQIILKELKKKNIEILFSYSYLQNISLRKKAQLIGRIKQNIKLCSKYGVNYSLVNLSNSPNSLRSLNDVKALKRVCEIKK